MCGLVGNLEKFEVLQFREGTSSGFRSRAFPTGSFMVPCWSFPCSVSHTYADGPNSYLERRNWSRVRGVPKLIVYQSFLKSWRIHKKKSQGLHPRCEVPYPSLQFRVWGRRWIMESVILRYGDVISACMYQQSCGKVVELKSAGIGLWDEGIHQRRTLKS